MSTMLFLEIVMANILISRKKTMVSQIHKLGILTRSRSDTRRLLVKHTRYSIINILLIRPDIWQGSKEKEHHHRHILKMSSKAWTGTSHIIH